MQTSMWVFELGLPVVDELVVSSELGFFQCKCNLFGVEEFDFLLKYLPVLRRYVSESHQNY